jgi:hypothetical protein
VKYPLFLTTDLNGLQDLLSLFVAITSRAGSSRLANIGIVLVAPMETTPLRARLWLISLILSVNLVEALSADKYLIITPLSHGVLLGDIDLFFKFGHHIYYQVVTDSNSARELSSS